MSQIDTDKAYIEKHGTLRWYMRKVLFLFVLVPAAGLALLFGASGVYHALSFLFGG